MPKLRIMTFNVENLLVRFNFGKTESDRYVSLLDADDLERASLMCNYFNALNDENRIFTALTRFGNPAEHDWLVVGDLNDYTETDGKPDASHALGALLKDGQRWPRVGYDRPKASDHCAVVADLNL